MDGYTLQPGTTVTYIDINLRYYEGIILEMSSKDTCEVNWYKPVRFKDYKPSTEWLPNLLGIQPATR